MINEKFLEILSRQNEKINFEETIVFQNNHDSYCVCCGRNMPPFYSYVKLTKNLSVTILVKRGPMSIPTAANPQNTPLSISCVVGYRYLVI